MCGFLYNEFDILIVHAKKKEIQMNEEQENKLIIAYLQDVIAQQSAYKEYKQEDSQTEEWWNRIPHGPSMGD
jgi:hypothetical protein|tara:strand:+ start:2184 stop:2399 length:216 start_codon:yes stop_codon:yes gene_type:complete